jgi:hypothetical protein
MPPRNSCNIGFHFSLGLSVWFLSSMECTILLATHVASSSKEQIKMPLSTLLITSWIEISGSICTLSLVPFSRILGLPAKGESPLRFPLMQRSYFSFLLNKFILSLNKFIVVLCVFWGGVLYPSVFPFCSMHVEV